MDRKYKAEDKVHVYQSDKRGPLLDTVDLKPYSDRGFDYYRYKDVMYPGSYCRDTLKVYILLDQPLRS